jgi:glycosyltransferase involved in cell wall biosynthesis
MLLGAHRSLDAAFDRFPTRKGASVHIGRFARGLFDLTGGGLLYVMGGRDHPAHQHEGDVEIVRCPSETPNLLTRALAFGRLLERLLEETGDSLRICHFRDPWSGVPVLRRRRPGWRTVYEVNGLPSIELPSTYPDLTASTLDKIRTLERFCLDGADRVVTPSRTTRRALIALGTDPAKIDVVPNGADITAPVPRPVDAPPRYLLYFGALQPWQGVETLVRALPLLADLSPLALVVCASEKSRRAAVLARLAAKLGVADRVVWRFALSEAELAPWRAHAALAIAPLRECSRNVVQGCAPLKVLEAMAAGVPVVASDLAPVREILRDGVEGRLVRPDRPGELARSIRVLLEQPEARAAMGRAGQDRIRAAFTWTHSVAALRAVHVDLLDDTAARPAGLPRPPAGPWREAATP